MTFSSDTTIMADQTILKGESWTVNSGVTLTIAPGVNVTGFGGITNNGHIENLGNLRILNGITNVGIIDNFGLISAQREGISITTFDNFGVLNNYGTIENEFGAEMLNLGSTATANPGIFFNQGLFNNRGGLDNGGIDGEDVNATATIINNGTFNNFNGMRNIAPGAAIINNGTFNNFDTFLDFSINSASAGVISNTGTIFNNGTFAIESATLTNSNTGTINNEGEFALRKGVIDNNGGTINNTGTFENDATVNNGGAIFVLDNGTINNVGVVNDNSFIGNAGTINNTGTINFDDGFLVNDDFVDNFGTINFEEGEITNNGKIVNECGATFINSDGVGGNPVVNLDCPATAIVSLSCDPAGGMLVNVTGLEPNIRLGYVVTVDGDASTGGIQQSIVGTTDSSGSLLFNIPNVSVDPGTSIILVIVPVIPVGSGFTIDIDNPLVSSEAFIFACSPPHDDVSDLINLVSSMNFTKGIENSLMAPLRQAQNILDDGNPDNDSTVCVKLDKFIHQVNVKSGKSLTPAEAQLLLNEANEVRDGLGC